jgi:hypothetical protein
MDRQTSLLALVETLPPRRRKELSAAASAAPAAAQPLAPGWQSKARAGPLVDDAESQLWRRLRSMGVVSPRDTVPRKRFIAAQHPPSDVAFHEKRHLVTLGAESLPQRDFGGGLPTLLDPVTGTYLRPSAHWREKGRVYEADGSPRTANRETHPADAYLHGTDLDSKKRRSPPPPPAAPPVMPWQAAGGGGGGGEAPAVSLGGGGGGRAPRPFQAPAAPRPSPPPAALRPAPLLPAIPPLASARSPLGPPPAAGYFVGTGRDGASARAAARALSPPAPPPAAGAAPLTARALSPTPPAHAPPPPPLGEGSGRVPPAGLAALPLGDTAPLLSPAGGARPGTPGGGGGSRPGTPAGGGGGSRPGTPGGGARPGTPGGGARPGTPGGGSRPGTPGGARPGTPGGARPGSSSSAAAAASAGGDGGLSPVTPRPSTPAGTGSAPPTAPPSRPATASSPRAAFEAAFAPALRPLAPPAGQPVAPLWTPRSLPALPLSSSLLPSSLRHARGDGSGEVAAAELPRATSALPSPEGARRGLRRGGEWAGGAEGGAAGGGGVARVRDTARATLLRATLASLYDAPPPQPPRAAAAAATSSIAAAGNSFHALPGALLEAFRDAPFHAPEAAPGPYTGRPEVTPHTLRGGVGGAALPPSAHAHPAFLMGVVDTSGSGHLNRSAWVDATAAGALAAAVAAGSAAAGAAGAAGAARAARAGGADAAAAPAPPPAAAPPAPEAPPPPPPPPMLRAGIATQGFYPAALAPLGGGGAPPPALRGLGDLAASGDLLGAPYGYTRGDGGAHYVRVDWSTLERQSLPSARLRGFAPPPPGALNDRSRHGLDGRALRPPPPAPLDAGFVGAVFSPLRSKLPQPLGATRARNDPEANRDWAADRHAGVNAEVARGRPAWPAEGEPPAPARPASVHAALRRHVGLRSGGAMGNGALPVAEEALTARAETAGAPRRASKRHASAAARAPAGLASPLEAAAARDAAAGARAPPSPQPPPPPRAPQPLPAPPPPGAPAPAPPPLTAHASPRALELLAASAPAGHALPHSHPYPAGAVPYVSQTDIHEAAEYVVSTLGLRQAALDEAAEGARRAAAGLAPPPHPRAVRGRRLTDVQPVALYARSALGAAAMADAAAAASPALAASRVKGLTLLPPASALPAAVAAAAAATARATTRFATPINAALPPPLHALAQEGAVPRTSLDGGDAAAAEGARGGGGAVHEAAARGLRFRAGPGAAQALGALPLGAGAGGLPLERPAGKARRPRPNSCPHRGWAGGAFDGGGGAAAAGEGAPGAPPAPLSPAASLMAPLSPGASLVAPLSPGASLMASLWEPEQGLDGSGSAFGRSGAASPASRAASPSRGGGGGGGGWGGAPLELRRPATGLSRTASPRVLPPRSYGAAMAQLSALSHTAALRHAPPAGGSAARGLEAALVSARKGGNYV